MMDWIALSLIHILLMGERYKMVTKETKDILLGKYGATVKPFNPEVQKKCIGDEKPITCRPADLLDNELEKLESEMAQYKEQDEDVLTYALFPQAVSYTHLDVYKRQLQGCVANMYAGNPVCCLVNPFLGHEAEGIAPAEKAKKVMVIGGGVAGLCAAFIAQEKGHQAVSYTHLDRFHGCGKVHNF